MKLKNIKIVNLFGLEQNNFDINLYPKENVTLLYGFNGLGKTSIIKLVSAIVTCDLRRLLVFNFTEVTLLFEDSSTITVKRNLLMNENDILDNIINQDSNFYHPISYIEKNFNENEKLYQFKFQPSENLTLTDFSNFQGLDPFSLNILKELQKNLQKKIDLHIILGNKDFNRIIKPNEYANNVNFKYDEELNRKEVYCSYNEAKKIVSSLSKQLTQIENSNPELWTEISDINCKNKHPYFNSSKLPKDLKLSYITEIPDKLIELNENLFSNTGYKNSSDKISLFEDIINNRLGLLYKNITFSDDTLKLNSIYENDPEVPLNALSSGEKNIICLFLELIFFGTDNSVFFIDEPESSLHIEWQSHLVDCLLDVCNKFNIQVIIATHAPEIIGEYDGLTTEITSERFRYGNKYFDN